MTPEQIKDALASKGYSLRKVAKIAGVGPAAVRQAIGLDETRPGYVGKGVRGTVAGILGMPLGDIFPPTPTAARTR